MSEHGAGFKQYTRVTATRATLLGAVNPLSQTEQVPLRDADERVVATRLTANRPVPHYERAAMDGYAVRAADTIGASVEQLSALLANLGELDDEPDGATIPAVRE